ncbi:uncharacterized protein KNAG_0H03000 [Huiozyma naganishii CBS 8797]|uniref:Uncharacterized protein n=1 Tax=Huiozyma naganishii (strain ATCC MYA-139 / BCRC 22969 / CBS 8797 / KCTC 17520 / NBRC 10181 / NCYC 3082 / Yp74L-3) TaxID=1071383 RepID=J7RA13_HUIN7|nr:hypothetical protein KNAG_0H03000 [Kazachstania naganishii CBS 8797]CCK71715.1 hypothetical protein KNAG_0H03000 [Kazachstania naganishii CBS 8797]
MRPPMADGTETLDSLSRSINLGSCVPSTKGKWKLPYYSRKKSISQGGETPKVENDQGQIFLTDKNDELGGTTPNADMAAKNGAFGHKKQENNRVFVNYTLHEKKKGEKGKHSKKGIIKKMLGSILEPSAMLTPPPVQPYYVEAVPQQQQTPVMSASVKSTPDESQPEQLISKSQSVSDMPATYTFKTENSNDPPTFIYSTNYNNFNNQRQGFYKIQERSNSSMEMVPITQNNFQHHNTNSSSSNSTDKGGNSNRMKFPKQKPANNNTGMTSVFEGTPTRKLADSRPEPQFMTNDASLEFNTLVARRDQKEKLRSVSSASSTTGRIPQSMHYPMKHVASKRNHSVSSALYTSKSHNRSTPNIVNASPTRMKSNTHGANSVSGKPAMYRVGKSNRDSVHSMSAANSFIDLNTSPFGNETYLDTSLPSCEDADHGTFANGHNGSEIGLDALNYNNSNNNNNNGSFVNVSGGSLAGYYNQVTPNDSTVAHTFNTPNLLRAEEPLMNLNEGEPLHKRVSSNISSSPDGPTDAPLAFTDRGGSTYPGWSLGELDNGFIDTLRDPFDGDALMRGVPPVLPAVSAEPTNRAGLQISPTSVRQNGVGISPSSQATPTTTEATGATVVGGIDAVEAIDLEQLLASDTLGTIMLNNPPPHEEYFAALAQDNEYTNDTVTNLRRGKTPTHRQSRNADAAATLKHPTTTAPHHHHQQPQQAQFVIQTPTMMMVNRGINGGRSGAGSGPAARAK